MFCILTVGWLKKKKKSFQAFPLAQAEKLDTTVQKQYSDEQVSEALSISEQRE